MSTNEVADMHGTSSFLGLGVNEHGTPVSRHRCASCGDEFSVCPPSNESWGDGCLADACASYDLARDVDIFFEPLDEAGLIQRGDA